MKKTCFKQKILTRLTFVTVQIYYSDSIITNIFYY